MQPSLDFDYYPHVMDPIYPRIRQKDMLNIGHIPSPKIRSIPDLIEHHRSIYIELANKYNEEFYATQKIKYPYVHGELPAYKLHTRNLHTRSDFIKMFEKPHLILRPHKFIKLLYLFAFELFYLLAWLLFYHWKNRLIAHSGKTQQKKWNEAKSKYEKQQEEAKIYVHRRIEENWHEIDGLLKSKKQRVTEEILNSITKPEFIHDLDLLPRQGCYESIFFETLKLFMPASIKVHKDVKLGPYYPDITLEFGNGFFMAIEIDEPYTFMENIPIHYRKWERLVAIQDLEGYLFNLRPSFSLTDNTFDAIKSRFFNPSKWSQRFRIEPLIDFDDLSTEDSFETSDDSFETSEENTMDLDDCSCYDDYLFYGVNRLKRHKKGSFEGYSFPDSEIYFEEDETADDIFEFYEPSFISQEDFLTNWKSLIWFDDIEVGLTSIYSDNTYQQEFCYYYSDQFVSVDRKRDKFFLKQNWIVIRFSERQVKNFEIDCLQVIENVINRILGLKWQYPIKHSSGFIENKWSFEEALKMSDSNLRSKPES